MKISRFKVQVLAVFCIVPFLLITIAIVGGSPFPPEGMLVKGPAMIGTAEFRPSEPTDPSSDTYLYFQGTCKGKPVVIPETLCNFSPYDAINAEFLVGEDPPLPEGEKAKGYVVQCISVNHSSLDGCAPEGADWLIITNVSHFEEDLPPKPLKEAEIKLMFVF